MLLPDRELWAWGLQASLKCTAGLFEAQLGTEKWDTPCVCITVTVPRKFSLQLSSEKVEAVWEIWIDPNKESRSLNNLT